MKKEGAFVGYREAPINFPPTFKYDVMKTIKRDKSGAIREHGKGRNGKRWLGYRSNPNLSEVQEAEPESTSRLGEDEERGNSMDVDDDNGSIISTAVTGMSVQSRLTVNGESDDTDNYIPSRSRKSSAKSKEDTGGAAQKLFRAKAALKAKTKWLSLIRSSSSRNSPSPTPRRPSQKSQRSNFSASSPQIRSIPTASANSSTALRTTSSTSELIRPSELQRSSSRKSVKSAKSSKLLGSAKGTENTQQETGYDSSSKQRVPSW